MGEVALPCELRTYRSIAGTARSLKSEPESPALVGYRLSGGRTSISIVGPSASSYTNPFGCGSSSLLEASESTIKQRSKIRILADSTQLSEAPFYSAMFHQPEIFIAEGYAMNESYSTGVYKGETLPRLVVSTRIMQF